MRLKIYFSAILIFIAASFTSCSKIDVNTDINLAIMESTEFLLAKPGQLTRVKIMVACNDPITQMKITNNSHNLVINPSAFVFELIDKPLTLDGAGLFNREVKSFMVNIPITIPTNLLGEKITIGATFTSSAGKTALIDCVINVVDFDYFTATKTLLNSNTKSSVVFYDANAHQTFTFESLVGANLNYTMVDIFNWVDISDPINKKVMIYSPKHPKVLERAASLGITGFASLALGETKMMVSPVAFQYVDDKVLANLNFATATDNMQIWTGMSIALKLADGKNSVIYIKSITTTNTVTIFSKTQLKTQIN